MSDCLSGSPYCVNSPSNGSYEQYRGELCGPCEEYEERIHCARCKAYIGEQDYTICDTCADELEEAAV